MPTTKKKTAKKTAAKPFEKLTPAQKRVQIARDVLAQLAAKRFKASPGTWVGKDGGKFITEGSAVEQVCDLTKKIKKCEVCGLGSLFVAAVERANDLKTDQLESKEYFSGEGEKRVIGEEDVFDYLGRFFDGDQLDAIEAAFEMGDGARDNVRAEKFCPDPNPTVRMTLIMENIIANRGNFDYDRKPRSIGYVTPGFKG